VGIRHKIRPIYFQFLVYLVTTVNAEVNLAVIFPEKCSVFSLLQHHWLKVMWLNENLYRAESVTIVTESEVLIMFVTPGDACAARTILEWHKIM